MGLRIKIFLPLLLSSLLLASYLYGFWLPRLLADAVNEYQRSLNSHLDSVAEGLVPPLLGKQLDAVYGNLDALLKKNENWISIELFDPRGRLLYPLDAHTASKRHKERGHKDGDVRTFKQDIRYLDTNLGNLAVKVCFTEKLAVIKREYLRILYLFFIVILLFFLITSFILELLVRRPIKLLADASQRLSEGDFEMPLPSTGNDEIGTLMESFVTMRDAISVNTRTLSYANEQLHLEVMEHKQAEKALRESETRFRAMVETTSDLVWEVDENGSYTYISPRIHDLLGYAPEAVLGKTPFDLMPPEEVKRIAANFSDIIAQRRPFSSLENINVHKDGHLVILETSGVPFFDEGGGFKGFRGIDRDITERRRVGDSLQESEERFRRAINAAQDGLWEWNMQTNQEFFAPRWCEIIGYSFDDPELPHTYDSWASRIHPDDYDRVMSALKNHLEKGARYDVDYRHRHKSGEYRWQNSRGQALFDESGKPFKMVGC